LAVSKIPTWFFGRVKILFWFFGRANTLLCFFHASGFRWTPIKRQREIQIIYILRKQTLTHKSTQQTVTFLGVIVWTQKICPL
jgi:hypothetical protein